MPMLARMVATVACLHGLYDQEAKELVGELTYPCLLQPVAVQSDLTLVFLSPTTLLNHPDARTLCQYHRLSWIGPKI